MAPTPKSWNGLGTKSKRPKARTLQITARLLPVCLTGDDNLLVEPVINARQVRRWWKAIMMDSLTLNFHSVSDHKLKLETSESSPEEGDIFYNAMFSFWPISHVYLEHSFRLKYHCKDQFQGKSSMESMVFPNGFSHQVPMGVLFFFPWNPCIVPFKPAWLLLSALQIPQRISW